MSDEIIGDPSIDHWLEYFEPYLSKKDYAKLCRKLSDLKGDRQQQLHKLRELILGGFLGKHGYAVEYERKYGALKPDWTVFKDSKMVAIVEVTNFHGKGGGDTLY